MGSKEQGVGLTAARSHTQPNIEVHMKLDRYYNEVKGNDAGKRKIKERRGQNVMERSMLQQPLPEMACRWTGPAVRLYPSVRSSG